MKAKWHLAVSRLATVSVYNRQMSELQQRIWKVASMIPRGRVATYGQIADLAGLPGRARMVSTALKKAPHDMQLPWHRIIGAGGRIAIPHSAPSYHEQIALLREEDVVVVSGQLPMKQYQWQPDIVELLFKLDY